MCVGMCMWMPVDACGCLCLPVAVCTVCLGILQVGSTRTQPSVLVDVAPQGVAPQDSGAGASAGAGTAAAAAKAGGGTDTTADESKTTGNGNGHAAGGDSEAMAIPMQTAAASVALIKER